MVGKTKLCSNFYSCWFSFLFERMTLLFYTHFLVMIFRITALLYQTHLCYKTTQITFHLSFLEGFLRLSRHGLIQRLCIGNGKFGRCKIECHIYKDGFNQIGVYCDCKTFFCKRSDDGFPNFIQYRATYIFDRSKSAISIQSHVVISK